MKLQLKVLKYDDERFDCSFDDVVLVDADCDYDPDKVIGLYNVTKQIKLENSFYKTQLRAYKAKEFA